MRRFHSYGPVDCRHHFCVKRYDLVRQCADQLIGEPDEGGHYFTIWGPRQTGKTWLVREVKNAIEKRYPERYTIGMMSVQGVVIDDESDGSFLENLSRLMWETFETEIGDEPKKWKNFNELFLKKTELFNQPVILFIDEFDSLPPKVIDRLVMLFRDMGLKRETYLLHGLALIGVRAVLGVDSYRGSPFNIQRSLRIPNFTVQEVEDLFSQYQAESGQKVNSDVIRKVFESTKGQPGLVCWFGELLTETYNPGADNTINLSVWDDVYLAALRKEWNNTILNLIRKAQGPYIAYVLRLFIKSDIPFTIHAEWCSYLYLNGIIEEETVIDKAGKKNYVCRFASPFVQNCLYDALTYYLIEDQLPVPAMEPLDDLSEVFEGSEVNIPALLRRYKSYLNRLKAKGINPWKDQPRRADLHLTEYVGHFHLYAWLQNAVGQRCVVGPEFPTGNGKVDLHLRCYEKRGIIEVKSFSNINEIREAKIQASGYARQIGINSVTVALFVPTSDEDVLTKLSDEEIIDGVNVTIVAIGWV